jgi:hypothetical protein
MHGQYLFDWDYFRKRTEDLEKAYLQQECFDLSFAHPEPGTSIDPFLPLQRAQSGPNGGLRNH